MTLSGSVHTPQTTPQVDCGFKEQNDLVRYGPTLGVRIGFDWNYFPHQSVPPNLPEKILPALVDTGATYSCIDSDLANVLQLPFAGQKTVYGVNGKEKFNSYLLPCSDLSSFFELHFLWSFCWCSFGLGKTICPYRQRLPKGIQHGL